MRLVKAVALERESNGRGDGAVGDVLRLGQNGEVGHDAQLHPHLRSTDPVERRRHGSALLFFPRADPPRVGAVLDRTEVGCGVEAWTIMIGSGPGRDG